VGPEAQGLSSKRGRVRAVSGSDLQGLPAGSDFNATEKNSKRMRFELDIAAIGKDVRQYQWVEFRTNCSGEKI
jgi:hypothetical protein